MASDESSEAQRAHREGGGVQVGLARGVAVAGLVLGSGVLGEVQPEPPVLALLGQQEVGGRRGRVAVRGREPRDGVRLGDDVRVVGRAGLLLVQDVLDPAPDRALPGHGPLQLSHQVGAAVRRGVGADDLGQHQRLGRAPRGGDRAVAGGRVLVDVLGQLVTDGLDGVGLVLHGVQRQRNVDAQAVVVHVVLVVVHDAVGDLVAQPAGACGQRRSVVRRRRRGGRSGLRAVRRSAPGDGERQGGEREGDPRAGVSGVVLVHRGVPFRCAAGELRTVPVSATRCFPRQRVIRTRRSGCSGSQPRSCRDRQGGGAAYGCGSAPDLDRLSPVRA